MIIYNFNTIKDAIHFLIEDEQTSFERYHKLSKKAVNIHIKTIWKQLANDELRHKETLIEILNNAKLIANIYNENENIESLPLIEIDATAKKAKQIFQAACNFEIAAYNHYIDVAKQTPDPLIQTLFLSIANEELEHKAMLEVELQSM
jgi:rubrerythrin